MCQLQKPKGDINFAIIDPPLVSLLPQPVLWLLVPLMSVIILFPAVPLPRAK